ncbi:hypothetical protein GGS26DRAFT_483089 [Hypomontagnella submonticulosa]|nr:hypothetical protein GGS26DRAFT_483089 [Hypomontagnella submonticulosa]
MAQLATVESEPFHPGEKAVRKLLRLPPRGDNPTHYDLPAPLGYRVARSPLVAFGALDKKGRPWATVWGGEAGFCSPVARDVLGVRATVDARFDPVLAALLEDEDGKGNETGEWEDDAVVKPEGGRLMAGLSIDLETRDRVKLAGRMAVGTATRTAPGVAELQLAMLVDESLGNCPKYLNKKTIVPRVPKPELVSGGSGIPLPRAAVELIGKADLFFIASHHGGRTMDANHRGGAPGFMRVLRNEEGGGGISLVYPEYSGNRLYQTLGNLHQNPCAGLVVPDFETGDVLYLTGRTTILVGEAAAKYMPRTKLAVRVDVEEARFVRGGLPFKGVAGEPSPYNPVVRPLASEKQTLTGESGAGVAMAALVSRKTITPTISRYVFKLGVDNKKRLKAWSPGHHVTFDFAPELDIGYSHMRDDDPQSLNDDFVRTFTVSGPLDSSVVDEQGYVRDRVEPEVEITVRRHGPATKFLERWNMRVPLEIPVLGFGGAEGFKLPTVASDGTVSVFIAAGVGITPLMAQAAGVLEANNGGKGLRVLWSLKGQDLPLAVDVLERISGLGSVTRLFITGKLGEKEKGLISTVRDLGTEVLERRIESGDILSEGEKGRRKFYCCTGPEMMRILLKWTEGEDIVYESFEY